MVDLEAMQNEQPSVQTTAGCHGGQNGGRALEYVSNSNGCKVFMRVAFSPVVLALRFTWAPRHWKNVIWIIEFPWSLCLVASQFISRQDLASHSSYGGTDPG